MSKVLCIYHGNCADGFGAAWAVRHALGEGVEFYPGVYQEDPPDVTGREVVIVDFSYKLPVLLDMASEARSVLVLDHHKSAMNDLAILPRPVCTTEDDERPGLHNCIEVASGYQPSALAHFAKCEGRPPLFALFDMDRSGAMIAWDFFNASKSPPQLLRHIQDRDLWRFDLPGTREIQANVFSHAYDFDVWDGLMDMDIEALREGGGAIERKHHKDVAELVHVTRRFMTIGGYRVPVANLPYTLSSDAGHLMCKPFDDGLAGCATPPFAACYWDTPTHRVFSLRSDERLGAVDVSEVASKYGGGGHRNAAGFRMSIGWEGE